MDRVGGQDTGNDDQCWNLIPIELNISNKFLSDSDIARSVKGKKINELCAEIGITSYDLFGSYKAKITQQVPKTIDDKTRGSYVVVTGITPTSLGEGKSTTTLGLVQSLCAHLKRNAIACIRQPSQGPTFGLKGGAAGGGYSQVWPMDEFNLHLTGDIHAITAANNLIAAAIDARMFHESTQPVESLFNRLTSKPNCKSKVFTDAQRRRLKKLGIPESLEPNELSAEQKEKFARLNINPDTISVNRVVDTNDRFLRKITVGQAATEKFKTRETKFDIAVASELMAILALASDLEDVERRVRRMVVGFSFPPKQEQYIEESDKNLSIPQPVTCDDLCITGAVVALIRDATQPTLMQSLEGTPVLVHCGPFANVAHGNSSIIADKIALKLVGSEGFVVTEAGFASDVGFEKFMDIKCRQSGLRPDCAVLVTTLKAIQMHGVELQKFREATKLTTEDKKTNIDQEKQQQELEQQDQFRSQVSALDTERRIIDDGLENLSAHIRNITNNFNVPVVVALNKFSNDKREDLEYLKFKALEIGASACCIADNWALGGAGALDLARAVANTCAKVRASNNTAHLLYGDDAKLSVVDKMKLIASRVYGATDICLSAGVEDKIKLLEANKFGNLPLCMAKTSMSISHDPKLKGAPKNYTFPIVDINVAAGSGFLYARAGEISTMPGLPTRPAYFDIEVNCETGVIDGLF